MRIILTGGAGFIGSHIADSLINHGHRVCVIDNLVNGKFENVPEGAEFHKMDIRDGLARDLMTGADMVVHMAALGSVPRSWNDPEETYSVNVDGFYNIFRAAEMAKVKKFIYASSSSVYGDSEHLPKKEDEIGTQLSPYSSSKRINELICQPSYMKSVGLRFFNVYGPRQREDSQYAAVIPKWIGKMRRIQAITIDGASTYRDFTYVSDAAQAVIKCMETDLVKRAEVFNIGTGRITTLSTLAALIRNEVGIDKNDLRVNWGAVPPISKSLASIEKAAQLIGYSPRVSIEQGIKLTVDAWKRSL